MSYPIGYATVNGDLFNLAPGQFSFGYAVKYDAPSGRAIATRLTQRFKASARTNGESARVNRDGLVDLPGSAGTFHQPDLELPGILQLRG